LRGAATTTLWRGRATAKCTRNEAFLCCLTKVCRSVSAPTTARRLDLTNRLMSQGPLSIDQKRHVCGLATKVICRSKESSAGRGWLPTEPTGTCQGHSPCTPTLWIVTCAQARAHTLDLLKRRGSYLRLLRNDETWWTSKEVPRRLAPVEHVLQPVPSVAVVTSEPSNNTTQRTTTPKPLRSSLSDRSTVRQVLLVSVQ
jgi:hypothetical protein